jgi:hypothetical protein
MSSEAFPHIARFTSAELGNGWGILGGMTQSSSTDDDRDVNHVQARYLPWSHQFNAPIRALICVLAGAGVGVIGTFAHRMGAARNIPYGLVLALAIVGISTWCARSRSGVTGLALHLISSSAVAWLIAMGYPNGDALTPIGFGSTVPYFSQHVGYLWLFGMILVQVALLPLPARQFHMPERRVNYDFTEDKDDANDGSTIVAEPLVATGTTAAGQPDDDHGISRDCVAANADVVNHAGVGNGESRDCAAAHGAFDDENGLQ